MKYARFISGVCTILFRFIFIGWLRIIFKMLLLNLLIIISFLMGYTGCIISTTKQVKETLDYNSYERTWLNQEKDSVLWEFTNTLLNEYCPLKFDTNILIVKDTVAITSLDDIDLHYKVEGVLIIKDSITKYFGIVQGISKDNVINVLGTPDFQCKESPTRTTLNYVLHPEHGDIRLILFFDSDKYSMLHLTKNTGSWY